MKITDEAKVMLKDVFKERGVKGIRLYSVEGGCCGPQLGLSLDAPKETDAVNMINGISVAMDDKAVAISNELTLDKEDTPNGPSLVLLGTGGCC